MVAHTQHGGAHAAWRRTRSMVAHTQHGGARAAWRNTVTRSRWSTRSTARSHPSRRRASRVLSPPPLARVHARVHTTEASCRSGVGAACTMSATCDVSSTICSPIIGCAMRCPDMRPLRTGTMRLIGSAKPTPSPMYALAVTMPIAWPRSFSKGPPLLP